MKKSMISLVLSFISIVALLGQSADIKKGCSPLEVKFSAPDLPSYFWDFIEGNSTSTLQNPTHIFTHPGIYTVTLHEVEGNNKIGEIEIEVFDEPIIYFEADTLEGCIPLKVYFTTEIEIDPELSIQNYKWAFGDGGVSFQKNASHTYNVASLFDVSLEINTDLAECRKIQTRENYITTNDLYVDFMSEEYIYCETPAKIKFKNNSSYASGNSFFWDFGNGQTSTKYSPDTIVYTKEGTYTISLNGFSEKGCFQKKERIIRVGKPKIEVEFPEFGCLRANIKLKNTTNAPYQLWTFDSGTNINASSEIEPIFEFLTSGLHAVKFEIKNAAGCFSDTIFYIEIENPLADFTLDPISGCHDIVELHLAAKDTTFSKYTWYKDFQGVKLGNGKTHNFIYNYPNTDSLYESGSDPVQISLEIISQHGCKSVVGKHYFVKKPIAHFVPSVNRGCAPLEVEFYDKSHSYEKIIEWRFSYGNGDSLFYNSPEDHSYIYTEPGEYYLKLIIENEVGCIDTSAGVWIEVGEPIPPEFELDKTTICLGDSISVIFKNDDPRIDAFHIDTDDGRLSHCWKDKQLTHVFNALPGEYSVVGITEYNGCYAISEADSTIKVNGAKADFGYVINCDNPYELGLKDRSVNASKLKWIVDSTAILDSTDFSFLFEKTGDYWVFLEAEDENSVCSSTTDSSIIYIRDIKADFDLPNEICDNVKYTLDGKNSVDVDLDCNMGYLWKIPTRRPKESSSDTIQSFFPRGENIVTLITEDINGCKDTLIKNIISYGIEPAFEMSQTQFCVPASIDAISTSESDTTIVQWEWSNGSTEKETVYNFYDALDSGYYRVWLTVIDMLGCRDEVFFDLPYYKPESNINLNPGENICVGNELIFSADDYTSAESNLNFNWDLEHIGTFDQQEHTVVFNERGIYQLKLNYVEESSGCKDSLNSTIYVVNRPVADFESSVDDIVPLCHPQLVDFMNKSIIDSLGYIRWGFGNVQLSDIYDDTQTIKLSKGTHDISLIAYSFFGCSDTISRNYTLVGPEGEVKVDKSIICIGNEVEFTLFNTVDVNGFQWDFGDGITVSNVNPVKHTFEREIELLEAKIVLKSTENGCSSSIDIPLSIFNVVADFDVLTDIAYCAGHLYLENLSVGADEYIWDYPGGELQNGIDTLFIIFPQAGTYSVSLIAINSENQCQDEISKTIELDKMADFLIMPNIFTPNGDGENDFFRPIVNENNYAFNWVINTFKVYNRWGNLVYNNEKPEMGWDGDYEGKLAPAEVYGYYIELDINGCQIFKTKGNISLVR